MSVPAAGLSRRTIGGAGLWLFAVGASSPMTVLAGSVVATYAGTGVVGVPLSFVVLGAALGLMSVGYVAVSRYTQHAATFYAVLVAGLGRVAGVAGAAVVVLAYNAVEISLFGLIGVTLAAELGGAWWVWAALVWVGIATLGVLHIRLNATVMGWALAAELLLIAVFDLIAFTHPAGGQVSAAPLRPDSLTVSGVGGAFALGLAACIGFEQPPVFAEEVRHPRSTSRATFAALGFLAVVYAVSSWALATAVGPDQVAAAAGADPQLPFTVLRDVVGPVFGDALAGLSRLLLVTSMFAAMLAFHNAVARNLFALGREGVVPQWLAHTGTGRRSGAPVAGSLAQSTLAAVVVAGFVVAGADPQTTLFTWLATLAAIGVLSLLVASSAAAIGFFARGHHRTGLRHSEGVWTRVLGPLTGLLAGAVVLAVTTLNMDSLLGVAPGSPATAVIPVMVGLTALAGMGWGLWLRHRHPAIYRGIGAGKPHPLAVLDQRLAGVEV